MTSHFTYGGYGKDTMVLKEGGASKSVYGFKIEAIQTGVQVQACMVLGRSPEVDEASS